jgi:hypothetical protein
VQNLPVQSPPLQMQQRALFPPREHARVQTFMTRCLLNFSSESLAAAGSVAVNFVIIDLQRRFPTPPK